MTRTTARLARRTLAALIVAATAVTTLGMTAAPASAATSTWNTTLINRLGDNVNASSYRTIEITPAGATIDQASTGLLILGPNYRDEITNKKVSDVAGTTAWIVALDLPAGTYDLLFTSGLKPASKAVHEALRDSSVPDYVPTIFSTTAPASVTQIGAVGTNAEYAMVAHTSGNRLVFAVTGSLTDNTPDIIYISGRKNVDIPTFVQDSSVADGTSTVAGLPNGGRGEVIGTGTGIFSYLGGYTTAGGIDFNGDGKVDAVDASARMDKDFDGDGQINSIDPYPLDKNNNATPTAVTLTANPASVSMKPSAVKDIALTAGGGNGAGTYTYTYTVANTSLVSANLYNGVLTLTGRGTEGTTSVSVTATSTNTATKTITIPVNLCNTAETSTPTTLTLNKTSVSVEKGKTTTITLTPGGGDGSTYTYTTTSSNTSVVTASRSGTTVTLTGVAAGSATVTIKATGANETYASKTVSVTVTNPSTSDTTPPTKPTLTASSTAVATPGSVTLSGTAEANSTVTLYSSGVAKATTTASVSGTFSFVRSLTGTGTLTYTVTATDAAGNISVQSAAVVINVREGSTPPAPADTTPPAAPTVTVQASAKTGASITVTVKAEANSTVKAVFNGVTRTGKASASGAFTATFTAPTVAGSPTVKVTATDAAGNVSATTTKTIKVVAPDVVTLPGGDVIKGKGTWVKFVSHKRPNTNRVSRSAKGSKGVYIFKFRVVEAKGAHVGRPVVGQKIRLLDSKTMKVLGWGKARATDKNGWVTFKWNPGPKAALGTKAVRMEALPKGNAFAGRLSINNWKYIVTK